MVVDIGGWLEKLTKNLESVICEGICLQKHSTVHTFFCQTKHLNYFFLLLNTNSKGKWCIYIAPLPHEDTQRRFTVINFTMINFRSNKSDEMYMLCNHLLFSRMALSTLYVMNVLGFNIS